ncbi:hypothetical protein ACFVFQ_21205 [Streptomyces sp. NPDC057743]|uniref:hypothetical protein n=1 Tax=Streptomyces sp. NPDC057743 TaxID=3346236 RepID=UPI0036AF236E
MLLSFAQQWIWFFHRLAPTSAVYNVAGAARMRGPLDQGELRHCLDEVVQLPRGAAHRLPSA